MSIKLNFPINVKKCDIETQKGVILSTKTIFVWIKFQQKLRKVLTQLNGKYVDKIPPDVDKGF